MCNYATILLVDVSHFIFVVGGGADGDKGFCLICLEWGFGSRFSALASSISQR